MRQDCRLQDFRLQKSPDRVATSSPLLDSTGPLKIIQEFEIAVGLQRIWTFRPSTDWSIPNRFRQRPAFHTGNLAVRHAAGAFAYERCVVRPRFSGVIRTGESSA